VPIKNGGKIMYEAISKNDNGKSAKLLQVQSDITQYLNDYPGKNKGLNWLANKMQLSEKTLKRIMKGPHNPTYQTLLKIYKCLLATAHDRETVLKMPALLAMSVSKNCESFVLADSEANFYSEINHYIQHDTAFRSIYIETATGQLSREKVGFEHGDHGFKTLETMTKMKVIIEVSPGRFKSSTHRAALDTTTLQHIAKYLLEYKFNPEKCHFSGENFFQLAFEGIDLTSYNEILAIDLRAKNEKLEILKKARRGEVKCWTLSFTDTLSDGHLYDNMESF